MIFPLPAELQKLKNSVDQLFSEPGLTEDNGDLGFCRNLIKKMGEAGLLRYIAPSPSVRDLCFLRYAIAQKSALGDFLFAMQGLGSYPISLAGNAEQKQKYLTAVAEGVQICGFAITEPEAGSDAGG